MNHINIKLLSSFFASVILLAAVSLYINFYTNSLDSAFINEISIKKAVDDINFYSVSIINNLNFYFNITSDKQSSLKEEYNYYISKFKQAINTLRISNRKDKSIFIINEKYESFLDNASKVIELADQKIQKDSDFANMIKEVDGAGDKVSKDSQILPAKIRNDVALMRNIEDIFYFRYQDKEDKDHMVTWMNSINAVRADLQYRENTDTKIEKDFSNYFDISSNTMEMKMNINDLLLNEQYFFDKTKYFAVDINSASNILSKTIDDESAITIAQSNRQKNISWIAILLFFILGGSAIFYISKGIVSAINNLVFVAKSVSAGDINQRAKIKSNDELEYLGNVFNKMLDNIGESTKSLSFARKQLEASNQSLEEKVRDRTAELNNFKNDLEKIVNERTNELQLNIAELEKFKELTVGRELKMIKLKKEIEKLQNNEIDESPNKLD